MANGACTNATCGNKRQAHDHGSACDKKCQACNGAIVVVDAPKPKPGDLH